MSLSTSEPCWSLGTCNNQLTYLGINVLLPIFQPPAHLEETGWVQFSTYL